MWTRMAGNAVVAAVVVLAVPAGSAERYTLEDWLTVSAVSSFRWAPDGSAIFLTSNATDSGTYQLFELEIERRRMTQLTRPEPGVRAEPVQQITVSADGERVYFASSRYFQNYTNLYWVPASGGNVESITFNDA